MSDNPIVSFLDQHQCQRRAYLGDGVYCGHDGEHVWLITERTQHPWGSIVHNIALDISVQTALAQYLRRKPGRPEKEDTD